MASDTQDTMEQKQHPQPKLQIYPTSSSEISPFWREKYEREAKKYWDVFYKHHQDRFFKDRHYLDKEWGHYFSGVERKVILEVGCGAGNTIFPLVATYPDIFVNACDFSPRAVDLVKMHKDFTEAQVNAFVCDLTIDDLCKQISPSSVDIVTMIFVLSAVSPDKMPLVLQNIRKVLKPNGYVLVRDYATGDLAQERLTSKDQKISENFYVRGDGTRAFYFSEEFLMSLFNGNGFDTQEYGLCCKQVENRSREIVMNRRWVQAVFRIKGTNCLSNTQIETKVNLLSKDSPKPETEHNTLKEPENGLEIDLSEGMAADMFGISPSTDEIIEFNLRDWSFKMKVVSKEHQHTCKSTGLMIWESAQLMASILASNQSIVTSKRVLELGSGCGGICSLVAAKTADLVVATDGDEKSLDLLTQNLALNLHPPSQTKLVVKKLEWGNRDHIEAVKQLSGTGFDVILGTDVTYVAEAILPLFETARDLLSSSKRSLTNTGDCKPALILCHVFRRVHEGSILSAASRFGFRLVDRWPVASGTSTGQSQSIIGNWFSDNKLEGYLPSTALTIMYFEAV
ncbi:hypothetical protein LguiA_017951 [Lonicera macranthoides]